MASSIALTVGTVAGGLLPFGLGASLALPVVIAAGADAVRLVSVQSLILMLAGAVGSVSLGYLAASTHPALAFGVAAIAVAVPALRLIPATDPVPV